MTTRSKITRTLSAIVLVAAASTTALAAVDPGDYDQFNVSAADPFGGAPVDTTLSSPLAFNQLLGSLSDTQTTDINQRCAVINQFARNYDYSAVLFCSHFFVAQGILPDDDFAADPANWAPNDVESNYEYNDAEPVDDNDAL